MAKITIVGAGMAGLLAANMLQHRHEVTVVERQPSLPHNHSAVLRFRTSAVGDALGVPFRPVTMIKAALPWRNPVADALAYAAKNLGTASSDRSIVQGTVTAERYIAPPDLIARMAASLTTPIVFGQKFNWLDHADISLGPVISTIPMPELMEELGYENQGGMPFIARPAVNIHAEVINCDAYASLLVPDPNELFSRVSVTGNALTVECPDQLVLEKAQYVPLARRAAGLLGLTLSATPITAHQSRYAKIAPVDDRGRKIFMAWATDQHNCYSLGRFASWRPGLLMDDLLRDVQLISHWIDNANYGIRHNR